MNQIKKEENEVVLKDKISDWTESREKIYRNISAVKNRKNVEDALIYVSGFPLKLHDGTRIHKISAKKIDEKFKDICVEFNFRKDSKINTTHFKRYLSDDLVEIEKFLENSQSIFQTRNIDLNYTLK
jgi:hypothetical protein